MALIECLLKNLMILITHMFLSLKSFALSSTAQVTWYPRVCTHTHIFFLADVCVCVCVCVFARTLSQYDRILT